MISFSEMSNKSNIENDANNNVYFTRNRLFHKRRNCLDNLHLHLHDPKEM